jgi:nucleoside 2-deoxyribosyltransferase
MKKMRVYLAGAIEGTEDGGSKWRVQAKELATKLSLVNILCPKDFNRTLDEDNPGWRDKKSVSNNIYVGTIRKIIKRDINALRSCDVCMVYWDNAAPASVGTHAELGEAFLSGIPVVTVVKSTTKKDLDKLPAWVIGCSGSFVKTLNEGMNLIQEMGKEAPDPKQDKINLAGGRAATV